jgi:hypothetical protein
MSSSQPSSRGQKRGSTSTLNTKPTTNTTKTTGPYDRGFQQNLIDGGVYPHAYEYPDGRVPAKPNNWEEIKQRLAQPRPSLSPSKFSEEAHEKFTRVDAHAFKEKQVTTSVIPIIEGEIRDAKCVSGGIPFTNLDHLTDGTLVPGNPDLYYGARPEQLDRRVRDELSGHIIPSTQDDLPIAPNFLLAAKGPDGSLAVAGRQASYDGALGARGTQSLRSYGQDESVYDNNAYTITSIYHGGQLKMYTSHPTQPTSPGGRPEYFLNQLKGWSMTSDPDTFRQGASWFRNARDWAKEQRDGAIARANERANDSQAGALAVDASDFSEITSFASEASLEPYEIEPLTQESRTSLNEDSNTETSTDELALDSGPPTKRSSSRSKQPQSQRKRRIVGESSRAGHSHRSAVISVTQSSPASDETTQNEE